MTDEGVRKIIGRLLSDEIFKREFFKDPVGTSRKSGFPIDEKEALALSKINSQDLSLTIKRRVGGEIDEIVLARTNLSIKGRSVRTLYPK